jgi:hypothetical protein
MRASAVLERLDSGGTMHVDELIVHVRSVMRRYADEAGLLPVWAVYALLAAHFAQENLQETLASIAAFPEERRLELAASAFAVAQLAPDGPDFSRTYPVRELLRAAERA